MSSMRAVESSLKQEIVRVACELGTELGEDGLTMRGIASRLGVSATALYQHFEGKSSILRAIRFHGLTLINDVLASCFEHADPLERVGAASRTYIQFARDNPWLYGVLFTGEALNHDGLTDEEVDLVSQSHYRVIACFREAKTAGLLHGDAVPEMATLQLWAANHGVASLLINNRLGGENETMMVRDDAAFIDAFVETTLRGFRRC